MARSEGTMPAAQQGLSAVGTAGVADDGQAEAASPSAMSAWAQEEQREVAWHLPPAASDQRNARDGHEPTVHALDLETRVVHDAAAVEGSPSVSDKPRPPLAQAQPRKRVPVWAWVAVAVACCAMSSGGIWFALLAPTPPVLKAAWRLTATSVLQTPGLIYQYRKAPPDVRKAWWKAMPQMMVSGLALAVHFATWSSSVDMTSLTHALLFVNTVPLVLIAWASFRYALSLLLTRGRHGGMGPAHRLEEAADDASDSEIIATSREHSAISTPADDSDIRSNVDLHGNGGASIELAAVNMRPPECSSSVLGDTAATTSSTERSTVTHGAEPSALQWLATQIRHVKLGLVAWLSPTSALPPTALEVLGTLLGFAGAALLILSAEREPEDGGTDGGPEVKATAAGDMMALVGAMSFAVYAEVGGGLRKWMPLFMYATVVTGTSAIGCALGALAFEGATLSGTGLTSVFGWFGSNRVFALTVSGAFVAGMLGHTCANLALQHVSPLLLSLVLLVEPLIGSIMGYFVGVQGVPGPMALVAGPLTIIGAAFATIKHPPPSWVRTWHGMRARRQLSGSGSLPVSDGANGSM